MTIDCSESRLVPAETASLRIWFFFSQNVWPCVPIPKLFRSLFRLEKWIIRVKSFLDSVRMEHTCQTKVFSQVLQLLQVEDSFSWIQIQQQSLHYHWQVFLW